MVAIRIDTDVMFPLATRLSESFRCIRYLNFVFVKGRKVDNGKLK